MDKSLSVLLSFGREADFGPQTLKALRDATSAQIDEIMAETFYQASQVGYKESFALIADRAIAKVLGMADIFK